MIRRTFNRFNRPESRYLPQPTVLVICEDSKSGLNYLKDARKYFRIEVKIRISHCDRTDPLGIVEEALRNKTKFDQIYCMIDRDSHESFNEAMMLARTASNIKVIPSFPCFEFWILIHFGHCRRPYNAVGGHSSADLLIKDLRRKHPMLENYQKGDDESLFFKLLDEPFKEARRLSPIILDQAIADGNLNPSTEIHLLINKFEELSKLQLVT